MQVKLQLKNIYDVPSQSEEVVYDFPFIPEINDYIYPFVSNKTIKYVVTHRILDRIDNNSMNPDSNWDVTLVCKQCLE